MTNEQNLIGQDRELLARTFSDAMGRVYMWMGGGMLITALVAMALAQSPGIAEAVLGKPLIYMGLFGVQMVLVFAIAGGIDKLSPGTALALFFGYSALMGVTMSIVFLVHDFGTVAGAFVATSATFGALSIVGLTTKRDLTSWGPILMASLFGLIIAMVVNAFLQSGPLGWVVSLAGVVVFMGLIVYDSKAIKEMTSEAVADGDTEAARRVGVLGALKLYLDFLNLFLFILSFLGSDD